LIDLPTSIIEVLEKTYPSLAIINPKLSKLFKNCFPNTLETATEIVEDGSTFVITGDIPAMWLRDSAAQIKHYIPFAACDSKLQRIIEGVIRRQIMYISIDPYANAFNREPNNYGHKNDITEHNPWVWERKYEIDSLCYPVQLCYKYWKETGKTSHFDERFKSAVISIINLWRIEQRHHELSSYRFVRMNCPDSDTLKNAGMGMPVNFTGMTWSGFRPSDDACTFGYHIPSNMFAVVVLRYIEEIARYVYEDKKLEQAAAGLREEIDYGISTYGIYRHPKYGEIYAYETDGYGNYNLMDDANVPSLLSIPYLGYKTADDPIYRNTRRFVLSSDNPYFYEGRYAKGIGSPHTPKGYIWHIGLIMQALTSNDREEIEEVLGMICRTDAGTGFMHESFDADNPNNFTREWFGWANSLFGELILYRIVGKDRADGLSEAAVTFNTEDESVIHF